MTGPIDTIREALDLLGPVTRPRALAALTEVEHQLIACRDRSGLADFDRAVAANRRANDLADALRDTTEQLGVWLHYIEAYTKEPTDYSREVLDAARAALNRHTQEPA